jgi:hypothetical protein
MCEGVTQQPIEFDPSFTIKAREEQMRDLLHTQYGGPKSSDSQNFQNYLFDGRNSYPL